MAALWYRTGTLTLTQGSREVSGAGTAFIANVRAGDMLIGPIMDMYEVTEVPSDTELRIDKQYEAASYVGTDWSIAPTTANLKQLAQQIASLVALYQDISGEAEAIQAAARAAAEAAAGSATTAGAAAANAQTSATVAQNAETAAAASAASANADREDSLVFSNNAKASETNAKTSETNAKNSETAAKTSETNAAASAAAAVISASALDDLTTVVSDVQVVANAAIPGPQKGVAEGVASLDASSRLVQQHALCETISAGTDANSVTLPGFYCLQADANATAALNWPVLLAGTLLVESSNAGNMQVTQTYTTRSGTGGAVRTFKRVRFGAGGGSWGTWQETARSADLSVLAAQLAQAFGVGQALQDVAAARAVATNYPNSTGRPILVMATALTSGANGRILFYLDGRVAQDDYHASSGVTLGGQMVVPAGATAHIVVVAASVTSWWEYR